MVEDVVACPACGENVAAQAPYTCPRCGASTHDAVAAMQVERIRALAESVSRQARSIPPQVESAGASVNGSGTMLLDYRPNGDGTWSAVRWVTLAYLPLVPREELRIRPVSRQALIAGERYRFEVLGRSRPSPARVLKQYAVALAGVLPPVWAFAHMSTVNRLVGSGPGFFVTLTTLVWFAFVLMRFVNADRAFKSVPAAATAEPDG